MPKVSGVIEIKTYYFLTDEFSNLAAQQFSFFFSQRPLRFLLFV